jgi:indole-3-glycerol phosphate synthase / phosphoribosylanthranilate isomerase
MVLEQIVTYKRTEVESRKGALPFETLVRGLRKSDRSLEKALTGPQTGFVFECKKASPSRGLLRADFDPSTIAGIYSSYADAISVIADERFFQGSLEYVTQVSKAVSLPVLCKDFVVDPYQVYEARSYGADAILLMLAVLDDKTLTECARAAKELGMDVLAEVHDENELARAIDRNLKIIGINNRNLKNLEVDLLVTERLAPLVPQDRIVVAESGIRDHLDVQKLSGMVDGFLVGSSLMSKDNLDAACRELVYGRVKVCGLCREEDAQAAMRAGAVYGGLIFSPESARRVDLNQAKTIQCAASLKWVGVFVNTSSKEVAMTAKELDLSAVQLHGDESANYIARLRGVLPRGCEVWKALRVGDRAPVIEGTGADRVLLDNFSPNSRGGTGRSFDWSLLKDLNLSRVILSGGLCPSNGFDAARLGAFGLDVNSGVELTPRFKSASLITEFFSALRCQNKERQP